MSWRLSALLVALLMLAGCQAPVRQAPVSAPTAPPPVSAAKPGKPGKPKAPAVATEAAAPGDAVEAREPLDNGAAVFDRLTARLSRPVCVDGALNRSWRQRYAGHPARFAAQLEGILPLLAYVLSEIEAADLPGEFALIPIVESWYRPEALAPGGPAGLWQFVPGTARTYGIRVGPHYDGRYSPVDATRAAIDHLSELHERFGDWRATAMAYNAGPQRLLRAWDKAGDQKVSGELRLPHGMARHTYDYIAKLRALACLIGEPQRHGLELPRTASFVPLSVMELPPGVSSLDQAAAMMQLDAAALRRLNPAYRHGRIAADAPRRVLAPLSVPMQVAYAETVATLPEPPPPPREHVIASGDTLSALAKRYGVSLADLLAWNGLRRESILRIGQRLRVAP